MWKNLPEWRNNSKLGKKGRKQNNRSYFKARIRNLKSKISYLKRIRFKSEIDNLKSEIS